MTALRLAQTSLEKAAILEALFLFESPRGSDPFLLIVATERAEMIGSPDPQSNFEYFRARAETPSRDWAPIHSFENSISATVCHQTKTVMFGPTGLIQMSPEGHGLGPALMASVISWLHKRSLHSYTIQPGKLSRYTVGGRHELIRRNKFYLSFGFDLSGYDASNQPATGIEVLSGQFAALTVGDLQVPDKYLERLRPSSDFYRTLCVERRESQQAKWEMVSIQKWVKSGGKLAVIKRLVLFLMGSPI